MKKNHYLEDAENNDQVLFLSSVTKSLEHSLDHALEETLENVDEDAPMPPHLEARVRALCKSWRRREAFAKFKQIRKAVGKGLIRAVAVAAMLHLVLYVGVEAYRVESNNVATAVQDGVSTLIFRQAPRSGVQIMAYLGDVPEGFVNTENHTEEFYWFARYENEDEWFIFERLSNDAQVKSNIIETTVYGEINGHSATFRSGRDDVCMVTWQTDTYLYHLTGTLEMDEMKLMAESVPAQ